MSKKNDSLLNRIGADLLGIGCLILVPIIGPLPGPGGIPLLIAGLGFLATNHKWAQDMLHYAEKHTQSLQDILFPNKTWVKWTWDIIVVFLIIIGTIVQIKAEWWFFELLSLGIYGCSTTLFMLNRDRIGWLDRKTSKLRKRNNKK